MSKRLHVTTNIEREAEGEWYCACDIGEVFAEISGGLLEQVEGLRVGPFPSRQVARRELRGSFRDCVMSALKAFMEKNGGSFESFEIDEGKQENLN